MYLKMNYYRCKVVQAGDGITAALWGPNAARAPTAGARMAYAIKPPTTALKIPWLSPTTAALMARRAVGMAALLSRTWRSHCALSTARVAATEGSLPRWTAALMAWRAVGMAALMRSFFRWHTVLPRAQCHADATRIPLQGNDFLVDCWDVN